MRNNRARTYAECVLAMTDKIKLLKNPEYAIPKPLMLGRIGYCLLRKYMKVWKLNLQGFANSLERIYNHNLDLGGIGEDIAYL